MSLNRATLLVVDDEPINLEIIAEYLADEDYDLVMASNGEEAWHKLQEEPQRYDAVILDRMMPGIDGIEVLQRIKHHAELRWLPVIMQTAAGAPEQVAEGLRAGAFYYLTKPFDPAVMRAVVATAVRDHADHIIEQQDTEHKLLALRLLDQAELSFRTTAEARQIALLLAGLCPVPQSAYIGLQELMLNAIEHGNLGITYDEKSQLISEDRLAEEVERRLQLPRYAGKLATAKFIKSGISLIFIISDEGDGFDWRPYLEISMERMLDNHGRGIAMSRSLSFTHLNYKGRGNVAEATIIVPAG